MPMECGLFELEQSLLRDSNGIIDFGGNHQHPYSTLSEAEKHAQLGEVAYVRERTAKLRSEFSNHLPKYAGQRPYSTIEFGCWPNRSRANHHSWALAQAAMSIAVGE